VGQREQQDDHQSNRHRRAYAANIRIHAVRVISGNAELLRSCASSPAMYYDVQQASQLNGVFTAIAQNLANLRIAK
jgi:hypothetical protein